MAAGLAGITVAESAVCSVGVQSMGLTYRGYDISALCSGCECFEEVAYLLLMGELPTRKQLTQFKHNIACRRSLTPQMKRLLEELPSAAHPMDVLRTGCSALGAMEPEGSFKRQSKELRQASYEEIIPVLRILGQLPSMLFYWWHYHRSRGQRRIECQTSLGTSMAEHILELLNLNPDEEGLEGHENQFDIVTQQSAGNSKWRDDVSRAMEVALILYAEHELNASTFAARVTASTLSDIHSAITAAIGTLKGPLHGGANEAAMEMLSSMNGLGDAECKLKGMISNKELVMGFGHRVYKCGDPRSPIIKEWSRRLASHKYGNPKLFEVSDFVESWVLEQKGMRPNLDFYSASVFSQCGIPTALFTPMFVIARTAGWAAHILEQRRSNKLIRPLSTYTGPPERIFYKIASRSSDEGMSKSTAIVDITSSKM